MTTNSRLVVIITPECACILDKKACMEMQKNQFKLSIWYDNEWSYANKVILLLNHMIEFNAENSKEYEKKYFLANKSEREGVVLRLDWNVLQRCDSRLLSDGVHSEDYQ